MDDYPMCPVYRVDVPHHEFYIISGENLLLLVYMILQSDHLRIVILTMFYQHVQSWKKKTIFFICSLSEFLIFVALVIFINLYRFKIYKCILTYYYILYRYVMYTKETNLLSLFSFTLNMFIALLYKFLFQYKVFPLYVTINHYLIKCKTETYNIFNKFLILKRNLYFVIYLYVLYYIFSS